MKTIKKWYGIFALLLIASCSPVQVQDSYVAPSYNAARNDNFLVITRAGADARNAFEQAMVKELRADGYKATASGEVYPDLDMSQKYNQQQMNAFIQDMESKGYDGVVVNVMKGVKNETSTYPVGGPDFYNYYPSYYYGFGGYYMNPMAYSDWMGPTEYDTQTYKVYTLETTVYDLNQPPAKQLVGIVTNEITDPSNLIYDADDYAKKVVKELDRKSK